MSVQEIMQAFEELTPEEQKQVLEAQMQIMQKTVSEPRKKRSIREFLGAGAHLYDGTDAQEQMRQLRSEWDNDDE